MPCLKPKEHQLILFLTLPVKRFIGSMEILGYSHQGSQNEIALPLRIPLEHIAARGSPGCEWGR